jgi:ATP adenylyltransferase
MSCLFCERSNLEIIAESPLAFAIRDIVPVTSGHTLLIPKKHHIDFFSLLREERVELFELVDLVKNQLSRGDAKITGFNIGMNCGVDAGQTIFHCHVHLIPRRKGDSAHVRGGVRGVIPDKMDC